jgi:hypothetical protein
MAKATTIKDAVKKLEEARGINAAEAEKVRLTKGGGVLMRTPTWARTGNTHRDITQDAHNTLLRMMCGRVHGRSS